MRKMFWFMLLVLLAGCSTSTIVYDPVALSSGDPETAEMVVIRDATYFPGQLDSTQDHWVVAVDGRNYAGLGFGQYTKFQASAGEAHELAVKRQDIWWHKEILPVLLEPGKKYYYLTGVKDHTMVGITQISEEEGQAWMARSSYVQVSNPK